MDNRDYRKPLIESGRQGLVGSRLVEQVQFPSSMVVRIFHLRQVPFCRIMAEAEGPEGYFGRGVTCRRQRALAVARRLMREAGFTRTHCMIRYDLSRRRSFILRAKA